MVIAVRSTAIAAFALRGLLEAGFRPDQVGIVLSEALAPAAESGEAVPTALWAGGMFRSLIGVEIPDDEVQYYEEALQDAQTLVMVRAADRYSEAMNILHRCGGEYMAAF